jgi:hypothetical protein
VTVYLKGAGDHEHIEDVSYEGEGCTISMAASSMLLEQVHDGNLTMDQVLQMDYNEMIEQLGRQIVASRPKCATLGLGTLKAAIRKYQKDKRLAEAGVSRPTEDGEGISISARRRASPGGFQLQVISTTGPKVERPRVFSSVDCLSSVASSPARSVKSKICFN